MNLDNVNLLNDCVFKALMTNPNNRELVVDVLHAITKIPKEALNNANYIGGEELPKKIIGQKTQITDVTVKINDKLQIVIEMNQYHTDNIFEKNTLYAFSKIVENTTKNIKTYPKIFLINIDNFNFFKTNKPILEFKIRDNEGNIETDIYNSIHIVLANIKNNSYNVNEEIKKFASFLTERSIRKLENEYGGEEKYMAAIRTVEELSKDPEFSGYYDLEEAHKQELEDMLNTGIRQGKEAGSKQEQIKIAKNLLKTDLTIDQISESTGFTESIF